MYRSSPLRSTLNTNVITGLGMCIVCTCMYLSSPLRITLKKTDFFGEGFHNFGNPYTLLWPNGDFSFIIPRHRVCRFDNPSTILCLACGRFDDPSKGAESAARQKQECDKSDCKRA